MKHTPREMNKQFQKEDLDVKAFVARFENDTRDIYAQRKQIVSAIGLRPGMGVADIGAGTGLYTFLFAEQVGPKGQVYAVDISPAFLGYIRKQVKERGLEGVVKPTRGADGTTNLPPASIDVAFICATYHHFEHPQKILSSIHQALRPGGRLVLIDFDLHKESGSHGGHRARAEKEVYFREVQAAGFGPPKTNDAVALKENFFAVFEKAPVPPSR